MTKNLMQEVEEVAAACSRKHSESFKGYVSLGRSCGENKSVATGQ